MVVIFHFDQPRGTMNSKCFIIYSAFPRKYPFDKQPLWSNTYYIWHVVSHSSLPFTHLCCRHDVFRNVFHVLHLTDDLYAKRGLTLYTWYKIAIPGSQPVGTEWKPRYKNSIFHHLPVVSGYWLQERGRWQCWVKLSRQFIANIVQRIICAAETYPLVGRCTMTGLCLCENHKGAFPFPAPSVERLVRWQTANLLEHVFPVSWETMTRLLQMKWQTSTIRL